MVLGGFYLGDCLSVVIDEFLLIHEIQYRRRRTRRRTRTRKRRMRRKRRRRKKQKKKIRQPMA